MLLAINAVNKGILLRIALKKMCKIGLKDKIMLLQKLIIQLKRRILKTLFAMLVTNKAILQITVQIKSNNSKKDKSEWNSNKKKNKKLVNHAE